MSRVCTATLCPQREKWLLLPELAFLPSPWAQLSDDRTTGGDTAELGKGKYKTFFVFRCDRGLLSRESQAFFYKGT